MGIGTELLARAYDVVRVPVAQLDETVADRPTPCADWTVGQLFDHMAGAIDMFAAAARGPAHDGDPASTALGRFDAAAGRSLSAWSDVTDLDATVSLPFGDFLATAVLGMNLMDSLVHGWDLGAALGLPVSLP